ncbi:MAG TPA: YkgJ family cysteine cluster protein [Acidimicrobiales bacterium]|nr:YkgJ family cysteine cluster protein [Acidimicrobiales bacterium]
MTTRDDGDTATFDAGDFASWFDVVRAAMRGEGDVDVPCDGCTACCRSSQFVHIAPDETSTLAAVPAALRFPAPALPPGHVVLGYDEQGRCPMLVDDRCSIYEVRPRACRTYDCRVFAASGVEPDSALVGERASRWRFSFDGRGRQLHDAARTAAAAIPAESVPNATGRAVGAIRGVV